MFASPARPLPGTCLAVACLGLWVSGPSKSAMRSASSSAVMFGLISKAILCISAILSETPKELLPRHLSTRNDEISVLSKG